MRRREPFYKKSHKAWYVHFGDTYRRVGTGEAEVRPQELLQAEARHYDSAAKRLVFAPEESKVEKWPRIIYLSDAAAQIVERLVKAHPTGTLFRNQQDRPWTNSSVNCEWVRLRHRLGYAKMRAAGIEPSDDDVAATMRTLRLTKCEGEVVREKTARELKEEARLKCRQKIAARLAPKFCSYHIRHSWLDRMLKGAVDARTRAVLRGSAAIRARQGVRPLPYGHGVRYDSRGKSGQGGPARTGARCEH